MEEIYRFISLLSCALVAWILVVSVVNVSVVRLYSDAQDDYSWTNVGRYLVIIVLSILLSLITEYAKDLMLIRE